MPFSELGKDYLGEGFTPVDNLFLGAYLPKADASFVKVYLYGLYLTRDGENTLEKLAFNLKMSAEKVLAAYKYWENEGLVTLSKTEPPAVTYRSVRAPLTPAVKLNAREYSVFVEELQRLFPEKVLTENEILAFIEILRKYGMEINAMLMIIKYCTYSRSVKYIPYILEAAEDWGGQGITTEEGVNARITELENNSEDMRKIFAALGLKSKAGIEERQLYLKWVKSYGFNLDAILTAARSMKRRGGMERLSAAIEELNNTGAKTAAEVNSYLKEKEDDLALSKEVARSIGAYYSSFDMVVETYILPWKAKGFERGAILKTAKYCFLKNIRTLEGMSGIIDGFYKSGLLSESAVDDFAARQASADKLLKETLEAAGRPPVITERDREYYRNFVENWGFSHEVILEVASSAKDKPFPTAYINRILSDMKEKGVKTKEQALSYISGINADSEKRRRSTRQPSKNRRFP